MTLLPARHALPFLSLLALLVGSAFGVVLPGDDHSNSSVGATVLPAATPTAGDIEINGDVDFFSVSAAIGTTYRFYAAENSVDPVMHVYDTDGMTQLAYNDDAGFGHDAEIIWTAPSTGTYFVAVAGYNTDTGAYTLTRTDYAHPVISGSGGNSIIDEDGSHNFSGLLATDADDDDATLVWYVLQAPANGNVTIVNGTGPSSGTITYTPGANYNGIVSFKVAVHDALGGYDYRDFSVQVDPVADAPVNTVLPVVTSNTVTNSASVTTGTWNDTIDLTYGGTSTISYAYQWQISTDGSTGWSNIGTDAGTYAIQVADAHQYLRCTVTATDTGVGATGVHTATATSLAVQILNTAPDAIDDAVATLPGLTTDEDAPLVFTAADLLDNDTDVDLDSLTVTGVGAAGTGTVGLAAGSVTYNPNGQFEDLNDGDSTADSFTYTISDGHGGTDTATVTITITGVNDAPVIAETDTTADAILEDAGETTLTGLDITVSDVDNTDDQQVWTVSVDGTKGTATVSGTGDHPVVTYTPNADANGTDNFTLQVSDGGLTDTVVVTVPITPVNDAPSISGFTATVNATEDSDGQPANGITYASTWTHTVTFGPTDEQPGGDNAQTLHAAPAYGVTHASGVAENLLFSTPPAISNAGVLSFVAKPHANGSAVYNVTVQDDGGTANSGDDTSTAVSLTITIGAVNDAPIINGGDATVANSVTVLEDATDAPLTVALTWTDVELDDTAGLGETDTLAWSAQSTTTAQGGTVSVTGGDGATAPTITYTPVADFNGADSFVLVATDGAAATDTITVTLTVTPVNDEPSFAFVTTPDQTIAEDAGYQSVAIIDSTDMGTTDENSGGANEQAVSQYVVTHDAAAGFFVPSNEPSIAANGTLTYIVSPNANTVQSGDGTSLNHDNGSNAQSGPVTVSVRLQDNGGTANSGVDLSQIQTFTIAVTADNDVPVIEEVVDQTTNEDTPLDVAVMVHDVETTATQLILSATSSNQGLVPNANISFSGTGTARTVTVTPLPNQNGSATITLSLQDNNYTVLQDFVVTVNPVNDAPSFTKGPDITVDEDAVGEQSAVGWATAIMSGPATATDESGQTLHFVVTNDNNALFSVQPALSAAGTGTFTLAADANGSATVTVVLHDDGGTALGGVDASAPQTFTITVNPVNDVPSFTKGTDQTVLEDAGAQTVVGWATEISEGPVDEQPGGANAQTLSFTVTGNTNAGLFAAGPAIAADGTLTYTPAANANGTADITLTLSDSGGTALGGVDTSASQTFTINVTAVNDVPSFTKGANVTVDEDENNNAVVTVFGWATAISAGPADESGQMLTFSVADDKGEVFDVAPAIAANGDLTFTLALNQNTHDGVVSVTVSLGDDGGTANGGVDESADQAFTITITPVNDDPVAVDDDLRPANVDEDHAVDITEATLIANDTDVDLAEEGDTQDVQGVISPSTNGAVVSFAADVVTYSPAGAFQDLAVGETRDDTFTYTLVDSHAATDTATVTVQVTGVNDAPVINWDDSVTQLVDITDEDTTRQIDVPRADDIDNGATLTWTASTPVHGGVIVITFGTGTAPVQPDVTYTPPVDWTGVDQFIMTVTDEHGATDTLNVWIIVQNTADAPSINSGATEHTFATTILEDGGAVSLNGAGAIGAVDPDAGQTTQLIWTVLSQAAHGTATLTNAAPANNPSRPQFTYTPAADYFGPDSFVLQVADPQDNADMITVNVTVTPVNDIPSFTLADTDDTVLEDSGARSVVFAVGSPGPADESGQVLTYTVSNDNNGLFSGQPAIASDGTLTFTPADDANGSTTVTVSVSDDGGTANGGVDTSADQIFTITVTPVNDVPSFTKGLDIEVNEDDLGVQSAPGWATAISAGPADEAGQVLTFNVSNDNNDLFSVQPALDASGNGTFTLAPDANGVATVTVTLADDGGTTNGGIDTSAAQTFIITVNAVNDAPTFSVGGDQTVDEDAGAQTIGHATDISAGPADEAGQVLTFNVSNDSNVLFSVQPAIAADGTLTYTLADDANGSATVTVSLSDDGGTLNGGVDTSADQTFTITVTPVNDVPSFTVGGDQEVDEDCGPQTVVAQATGISTGPADEAGQDWAFNVSNDNNGLFSEQPAIAADGTLTYTPADDAYGVATVTVSLSDDGGTDNGGVDTSADQTFTITVNPVNDGPTALLIDGSDTDTVDENQPVNTTVGLLTVTDADPADVYTFTRLNLSPFIIVGNQVRTNANFDYEIKDGYTMDVRADCAASGDTFTTTLIININDVNEAPTDVTVVPSTLTVSEDAAVNDLVGTLDATDVDAGDTHTFAFAGGGTDNGMFKIVGDQLLVSGPLDFEAGTPVTVSIVATDTGALDSPAVPFDITLTDVNEAPTAEDAGFAVDENAVDTTVVGTVTATDPDTVALDTLEYVITAGDAGGIFAIDSATGEITVADGSQLDYETTQQYVLTVTVKDRTDGDPDQLTDTATITIDVNDVNEAPTADDDTFTFAEDSGNGAVVGIVSATDPDTLASDTLEYAITVGDLEGVFAIDGDGEITVVDNATLDFETTPQYVLTVTVKDRPDGDPDQLTGTATITIDVTNVNEAPYNVQLTPMDVDENTPPDTLVGIVMADDQDDAFSTLTFTFTTAGPFAMYAPGDAGNPSPGNWAVVTAGSIDHENLNTYACELTATDPGSATSGPVAFDIVINDVNEFDPVGTGGTVDIDENAAVDDLVFTVTATDQDGTDVPALAITDGNEEGLFAIDPVTGAITVAGTLDYETLQVVVLEVTVTDRPVDPRTDVVMVTINVNDLNEAPTVADANVSVDENAANGTVVAAVVASDPDTLASDTLSYEISGTAFAINGAGQITVADRAQLDFESTPQFVLTVVVKDRPDLDPDQLTDTATVTIDLNDLSERSISLRVNPLATPADLEVSDEVGPVLTVPMTDDAGAAEATAEPLVPTDDHTLEVVTGAPVGVG